MKWYIKFNKMYILYTLNLMSVHWTRTSSYNKKYIYILNLTQIRKYMLDSFHL